MWKVLWFAETQKNLDLFVLGVKISFVTMSRDKRDVFTLQT